MVRCISKAVPDRLVSSKASAEASGPCAGSEGVKSAPHLYEPRSAQNSNPSGYFTVTR